MRSMCLLNKMGDTSIVWTPDMDEKMLSVIQKKMSEGITFYIIDSDMVRKPARSAFDVGPERKVIVGDADFEQLFRDGVISMSERNEGQIRTLGIARTAEQVAQNHTVGVRQQRGG